MLWILFWVLFEIQFPFQGGGITEFKMSFALESVDKYFLIAIFF